MLGSYPIGSQAVGGGTVVVATTFTVIEAIGRSNGSASVFGAGAMIAAASGKAVGRSFVLGVAGHAPGTLSASSHLVFAMLQNPYVVEYNSDIKYVLTISDA